MGSPGPRLAEDNLARGVDTGSTQREVVEVSLPGAQGSGEHCRPCSTEAWGVPFLLLQKSVGDGQGAISSARGLHLQQACRLPGAGTVGARPASF